MEFSKAIGSAVMAAVIAGCGSTEIVEAPATVTPDAPATEVHALSLGETNRLVGDVALRNDSHTLYVTVTAHTGLTLDDVRVCLSVSAFSWVAPQQCSYTTTINAMVSKATVAIPLADLGESVTGDVLYVQAAASVVENRVNQGFAYAGTFKGRVAYTIERETPATGACVLSAEEWAGGKKEWPIESITLGGDEYRQEELVQLIATPSAGDASMLLAKQAIAARLNAASGAELPFGVANALVAMESWLPAQADVDGALPFEIAAAAENLPNSDAFDFGVNTAEMIRQFNIGKLSAPACE